jgi:signal peptidase II
VLAVRHRYRGRRPLSQRVQTMRRYLGFFVIPLIFVLDRWTKELIIGHVPFSDGFPVTGFFNIVHARNLGGAFGFLSHHHLAKYLFTFFPILVMAGIVYVLFAYRLSFLKLFSLICILSGAIGNMYDRLLYGYVVDFLDFYVGGYHWPAFNVADISISTGIGLWLLAELLDMARGKRQAQDFPDGRQPSR